MPSPDPYGNRTGVFDVRKYFAKGDGATDDSIAIQGVIDAAVAVGGGEIRFPPGEYMIGRQINLPLDDAAASGSSPLVFSGSGFASCVTKNFSGNMFSGLGVHGGNRVRHLWWQNLRLRAAPDYTGNLIYLEAADMLHFRDVVFDGRVVNSVAAQSGAIDATDSWDATFMDCFFWGLGSPTVPIILLKGVLNNCNEWKFFGCRWERGNFNNSTAIKSTCVASNRNHAIILLGCKIHGAVASTTFTAPAVILENTWWSQIMHTTELFHNAHGGYVFELDADCKQNVIALNYTYNLAPQASAGLVSVAGNENIIGPHFHSQNPFSVGEVLNTGASNLKLATAAL